MTKETKKQRWQRIASQLGIKFQENDTVDMLVTAIAHKLKIEEPGEFSPSGLIKTVDKILAKKDSVTVSKPKSVVKKTSKKETAKKEDVAKKNTSISTESLKTKYEMKAFCVKNSLNKLDGYLLESKGKQVDFLAWINSKLHLAKPVKGEITVIKPTEIPSDPIEAAKKAMGMGEEQPKPTKEDLSKKMEDMKSYAKCLYDYIADSPAVRIHGKFSEQEFDHMLKTALRIYTYEKQKDKNGTFITMQDENGNELRIPERGYLPM